MSDATSMLEPKQEENGMALPSIARQAVGEHLRGIRHPAAFEGEGYLAQRRGVFVTIRTRQGALRGCRGTIEPVRANLVEETRGVAVSSAFFDTRFDPVQGEELGGLSFEVSVLQTPERVHSLVELDAARYGVIVRADGGRQAVMLPGLEGLDSAAEQVAAARRKAGIRPDESIELFRFRIRKFTEAQEEGPMPKVS